LKGGGSLWTQILGGKGRPPPTIFGTRKVESLSYRMVKKIAEKLNRLSRVHQRHRQMTDRQTTDGRLIAYSDCEREFTFAKNPVSEVFSKVRNGCCLGTWNRWYHKQYLRVSYICKTESVCVFFCSLCKATVLSGSGPNFACDIVILRMVLGLASGVRARAPGKFENCGRRA